MKVYSDQLHHCFHPFAGPDEIEIFDGQRRAVESQQSMRLHDEKSDFLRRSFGDDRTPWMLPELVLSVQNNHLETNLEFRKRRSKNQKNKLKGMQTQKAYGARFHTKGNDQFKISHSPASGMGSSSLNPAQLYCDLKDYLLTKRILKENASRKLALPGAYLLETVTKSQEKLSDFRSEEPANIFWLATSSKENSMKLQSFITDCTQSQLEVLSSKLKPLIPTLIVHKFGSFVLQRLLVHFDPSFEMVEDLCKLGFLEFIKDEYSSRVMQLLIEKSPSFCDFVICFFKKNLQQGIACSSACHLLVASLKNSSSTHSGDFITGYLRENQQCIGNRFFQRVLLTYVHVCTKEQQDEVAKALGVTCKICKLFNRKATMTIIHLLLLKDNMLTIQVIYHQLSKRPKDLIETKYFTSTIYKLMQENSFLTTDAVFTALVNLPSITLEEISDTHDSFYQLCFLLFGCYCMDQPNKLAGLLKDCRLAPLLIRLASMTQIPQ